MTSRTPDCSDEIELARNLLSNRYSKWTRRRARACLALLQGQDEAVAAILLEGSRLSVRRLRHILETEGVIAACFHGNAGRVLDGYGWAHAVLAKAISQGLGREPADQVRECLLCEGIPCPQAWTIRRWFRQHFNLESAPRRHSRKESGR